MIVMPQPESSHSSNPDNKSYYGQILSIFGELYNDPERLTVSFCLHAKLNISTPDEVFLSTGGRERDHTAHELVGDARTRSGVEILR